MAKYKAKVTKIVIDPKAVQEVLRKEPGVKFTLQSVAAAVAAEAQRTAGDAENGAGGTIDGYASAGFSVQYEQRSRRPRVLIVSNADPDVALAAHFNSQRKNGIGHLRAALQSVFPMKKFKKWAKGRPYSTQFGQSRSNAKK